MTNSTTTLKFPSTDSLAILLVVPLDDCCSIVSNVGVLGPVYVTWPWSAIHSGRTRFVLLANTIKLIRESRFLMCEAFTRIASYLASIGHRSKSSTRCHTFRRPTRSAAAFIRQGNSRRLPCCAPWRWMKEHVAMMLLLLDVTMTPRSTGNRPHTATFCGSASSISSRSCTRHHR